MPLPHLLHVGAHLLAELGDLVHERDPGGQHGVGGVLGHLGRRDVHEENRIAGAHEGGEQLAHAPRATPSQSTPTTTRSGFMKSSIAAPSLRNSGLEQTETGTEVSAAMAARTRSAVPTGTVDLVTTILGAVRMLADGPRGIQDVLRSAEPSSSGGVPTAMKTTRAASTAAPTSVVNCKPALRSGCGGSAAPAPVRRSGCRWPCSRCDLLAHRRRRRSHRCRSPPGRPPSPDPRSRCRSPRSAWLSLAAGRSACRPPVSPPA